MRLSPLCCLNFNQNSPMLLPFPVPRSYCDHMYHRLRNGQVWELSPTQVNFTNSELNFHFSPRSAVLLLRVQFSISEAQGQPVNFWPDAGTSDFWIQVPTNFYESQGHIWNRWYFDYFFLFTLDQCPFALKAQHFWVKLLCKACTFRSCKVSHFESFGILL